jgi:hypothetical protein
MEDFYIISESDNKPLTKTEIKKIVKGELEKQLEKEIKKIKFLDEKDIKKIIKDTMINQYKYFWEKRSFWVNNI